ncbi:DUF4276 family protein [soil metagenome]
MKRVIIICEGPTEVEFCKDVLQPYLFSHNIFIETPRINKAGGIVPWGNLKRQVELHLKSDSTIVTTFFDFYGMQKKHLFPSWEIAITSANKNETVKVLEEGMLNDLDEKLKARFIPYIQLHEFEGLLFNNLEVFQDNFEKREADFKAIERIIRSHPNPEMINDNPNTAPSKRLIEHIKGYSKVVYGATLATCIGLDNIRAKSPRFDGWVRVLERL